MGSSCQRLVCLLFVSLVFSVLTYGQDASISVTPSSSSAAGSVQSLDPGYILQPNDFIKIEVFQEPDLTTTSRVSGDGNITMALIGTVKVAGITAKDATDKIRSGLMKDYLVNPQVSISIVEFAKRRFTILGQVAKPGSYEIPAQERADLLQAVALAGGFTRIALASSVSVRRREGTQDKVYKLNAKAMQKDTTYKPFYIQENDVITIPESIF